MQPVPPADTHAGPEDVRELLRAERPDLACLPLRLAASGWDNDMWRLGDSLAVRLPRRRAAAPLARREQRWLPVLATLLAGTGIAVPAPIHCVPGGHGHPYPWAIVPWIEGTCAEARSPRERDRAADGLRDAFRALHVAAPEDGPVNPVRGGSLARRAETWRTRLLHRPPDQREPLREILRAACAEPAPAVAVWLHGDPHPGNAVLGSDGRLAGLLDFGDVGIGDRASDLGMAWAWFTPERREQMLDDLAVEAGSRARARGWAIGYGLIMADLPADNPLHDIGEHTLHSVLSIP